jgi:hypothetical protein
MARVLVAAQVAPGAYPIVTANSRDITWQASDASLHNYTPLVEGKTVLLVQNINASAKTVTLTSVADTPFNRTGDVTAYSLDQYEIAWFGPFKAAGWSHGAGATGGIWIDTNHADVMLAVITLP